MSSGTDGGAPQGGGDLADGEVTGVSEMDLTQPYRLHPKVALRPEKFGALAYHYDTRRLAFLKSQLLVDAVKALEAAPDAATVVDGLGLSPAKRQVVVRAMSQLLELGILAPR